MHAQACVIDSLRTRTDVLDVQPNYVVHATTAPNDPSFGALYGMANSHATGAWQFTTGGTSAVVAVIDSGVSRQFADDRGLLLHPFPAP